MVKLKKGQETFVIVDGPESGRKFSPGVEYDQAPKGYENRFGKVKLGVKVEPKVNDTSRKRSK